MIIATLAVMRTRAGTLPEVVASIAPQVDRLFVYLNGDDFKRVPEFLRRPNVHAVLAADAGFRGPEAKFWHVDPTKFAAQTAPTPDDIHVVCDDDFVYPPDYVHHMVNRLEVHGINSSVVCVHGSIFQRPLECYYGSRVQAMGTAELKQDTRVHIPGSATMVYRIRTLNIRIDRDFAGWHVVDPMLGVICKQLDVPVWSVARQGGWLTSLRNEDTLNRKNRDNSEAQTALVKREAPWPDLEVPSEVLSRGPVMRRILARKAAAERRLQQEVEQCKR